MSASHSTPTVLRACAYYRKSTDDQANSIDRQRNEVVHYTAARGYRLVAEYKDEGIAGDVFDRRLDFQKMLAAAGRREFDVIVVDEPSRLSRQNPIELIEKVIAPLKRSGVKLDTKSKGPIDYDSLPGIILMTVHASKSEDEVRDLSGRTLGGIARRVAKDEWFGGATPFGLRVVREIDPHTGQVLRRRWTLGPDEEVRAVRFIFDAIANKGWPVRRVCRELDARGVPTPGGKRRVRGGLVVGRWNPRTICKLVRNRRYVGDAVWNETSQGKYSCWKGGADGRVERHAQINTAIVWNAPEDVVVRPDRIPALVDRDTFARAVAVLEGNAKRTCPCRRPEGYLFTHLLVCGDCGSYLNGQPHHGRKQYLCSRYKDYGTAACHRNAVYEEALKQAVFGALQEHVLNPDRVAAIEAEVRRQLEEQQSSGEAPRLRAQIKALDRDIQQGNANLARLPEDLLAGVVAQVRQWETDRTSLRERLAGLEGGPDRLRKVLDRLREKLWRLRESLLEGGPEEQAVVLREVVSKVEIRFAHAATCGWHKRASQRRRSRPVEAVVWLREGLGEDALDVLLGNGGFLP
jgi:DNA invertase Pin-like site-specific DNA recombinase